MLFPLTSSWLTMRPNLKAKREMTLVGVGVAEGFRIVVVQGDAVGEEDVDVDSDLVRWMC